MLSFRKLKRSRMPQDTFQVFVFFRSEGTQGFLFLFYLRK